MSQRWSISGVMDHVNRKLFWFEKKTHKELIRTVSVAKSEVGWHLSGEDEQWECQGQPGTRQESGQPGPEPGAPSSQEDRTGQPSSGWLS